MLRAPTTIIAPHPQRSHPRRRPNLFLLIIPTLIPGTPALRTLAHHRLILIIVTGGKRTAHLTPAHDERDGGGDGIDAGLADAQPSLGGPDLIEHRLQHGQAGAHDAEQALEADQQADVVALGHMIPGRDAGPRKDAADVDDDDGEAHGEHCGEGDFLGGGQLQGPEHGHGQHDDDQVQHDVDARRRQLERLEVPAPARHHRVHRPDLVERGADGELARDDGDGEERVDGVRGLARAPEPTGREQGEVEIEDGGADEEDAQAPEDGADDGAASGHYVPGFFHEDGAGEGEGDEAEVGEEAADDEVVVQREGEALDAAGVEAEGDGEDGEEGEEREGDHVGGDGGAGHVDVITHGGRVCLCSKKRRFACMGGRRRADIFSQERDINQTRTASLQKQKKRNPRKKMKPVSLYIQQSLATTRNTSNNPISSPSRTARH